MKEYRGYYIKVGEEIVYIYCPYIPLCLYPYNAENWKETSKNDQT
jgi:hypothetical protein